MNRIFPRGAGVANNDHSGADEMLLQKFKMHRIDKMKQHQRSLTLQPMPFASSVFLLRFSLQHYLHDRKFFFFLILLPLLFVNYHFGGVRRRGGS
jgi:hypothetical protein